MTHVHLCSRPPLFPFIHLSHFSRRPLARNHISPVVASLLSLAQCSHSPGHFSRNSVEMWVGCVIGNRECATLAHRDSLPVLLQHRGVRLLDAEHQVAEGTVDVVAAALQRRVVGRVAQVHRDGARLLVVGRVQRVQLAVARPDDARVGARRQHYRARRLDRRPTSTNRSGRLPPRPCPCLACPRRRGRRRSLSRRWVRPSGVLCSSSRRSLGRKLNSFSTVLKCLAREKSFTATCERRTNANVSRVSKLKIC